MDGSQISPYDYRSLLQDSEHFSSPKSAALDNFDGFSFENGPNSESLLVFSTIQRSFPTNAFPSNLSPQIEDDRKSITTDFLNIADPTTEETQIENEIHSPFKFNIDNYSRSPIIWEQDEPIFPKAGVDSTATPWTSSMPTLFSQKNDHYEMLLNTVSTKLLELIVATTRLTTQQSQIDKNLPEIVASAVSSKFVDSFTQLKHNMLEVVEEIRKHRGADGKTTEIYSKLQELSQMVSKLSNENKDSMNALKNQISILAFSNVQMRNEVLSRLSNLTQKLETLTETTAKFYERVVSDVASAIEKSVSSAIDERMQDLEKAVLEKFVPEPAADENQTKDSEKLSEIKELMDKTETGVRSISNDMKLVEARLQATATEKLQDFLVEIEKVKSRVENVSSVVNDKIDDQMSESKKNGKKALEEIKESEVRMFKALEDIGDRFEAKAEISDMKIDRILKIADELEKPADYKEKMDELKRFLENKMDVMEQNIMNRFDRIETSISEYQ
ncbi:hypothetical protein HK098_005144 [Nowakowskiella sp. JEL0407]|nr:hypothetical protein HK098_005144 [Nowakowskiella sp. JEL0407]